MLAKSENRAPFYDDFPTFNVLCKSFVYKKNHQRNVNIFRVGSVGIPKHNYFLGDPKLIPQTNKFPTPSECINFTLK